MNSLVDQQKQIHFAYGLSDFRTRSALPPVRKNAEPSLSVIICERDMKPTLLNHKPSRRKDMTERATMS